MPITPFGRFWEWRHSIWLIWILFPFGFLAPISFFYISIRGRKLKWLIMSLVFGFFVAIYYTVDTFFGDNDTAVGAATLIMLIGWIGALALGFTARREYLQILARRRLGEDGFILFLESTREEAIFSTLPEPEKPMIQGNEEQVEVKEEKELPSPKPLQINKAKASELRALPGIDSILATSIVETRKKVKRFRSFNHLVEEMKVQPHVLAQAQAYLTYTDSEYKRLLEKQKAKSDQVSQEVANKGKQEEKSEERNRGRIVDY